jgi:hypothetical protein
LDWSGNVGPAWKLTFQLEHSHHRGWQITNMRGWFEELCSTFASRSDRGDWSQEMDHGSSTAAMSKAGSILVFAMIAVACDRSPLWSFNREEVVLSWPQPQPGWITIEYGNPSCPPLERSTFGRRIVIPSTAYVCTSSPADEGWVHTTFIAIEADGRSLDVREKVHKRHSLSVSISSHPSKHQSPGETREEKRCTPSAEVFWYGSRSQITADSWAHYEQRHPECP